MSILVSDMIAQTRVQSGLRANKLFSDDQIAELLSDAYADFRDKVDARNAFWFKETYPFDLNDGNTLAPLSTLIPDLKEVQYVNRINGNVKSTVTSLGSIAERNSWTSGAFGFGGRRYFVDGDTLEMLPPPIASGSYELVYTPQYEQLATPHTRSFAIDPGDAPHTDSYGSGFIFANGAFTEEDVGAVITVQFNSPNDGYSGQYVITGLHPGSSTWIFTDPTVDPLGFTYPATGPDPVVTFQPAGTRADLPQSMRPWAQYLVTHACIAIRTSRKQDTSELERKLALLSQRVITATKTRTQGVQQAPITRRRRGFGGSRGGW